MYAVCKFDPGRVEWFTLLTADLCLTLNKVVTEYLRELGVAQLRILRYVIYESVKFFGARACLRSDTEVQLRSENLLAAVHR